MVCRSLLSRLPRQPIVNAPRRPFDAGLPQGPPVAQGWEPRANRFGRVPEIKYLASWVETKPRQECQREQRRMVARFAIDLYEIARPEILDASRIQGTIPRPIPSV